jgi:hypothetical protein
MGGLIAFADAKDLPEGASPRNWDVDYTVGNVFTRPGLSSVFSYATTLFITGYASGSGGFVTFTYNGSEPTVNEGFVLAGFTGALASLNGQEVFVESFTMSTFTAFVANAPILIATGLTATAVSTTGIFLGPNVGSVFTTTTWTSPSNISSPTNYASATSGVSTNAGPTAPSSVFTQGSGAPWTNPGDFVNSSAFATASLTANSTQLMLANGTGFTVPAGATITGIVISLKGNYSGSGNNTVTLQLATNGFAVGTPLTFAVGSTSATYTKGSSLYQWGTTFTPTTVNGTELGVFASASSTGSGTISLNNLLVTVYYTTGTDNEVLMVQGFSFAVSSTIGITGFGVSFQAYSSANTSVILQLLQNGIPAGDPKTVQLTTTPTVYSIGGSTDVWGDLWSAGNVNAVSFGVQLTASGVGVSFVGDLDITTYVTPALANFNWFGSYEQNNDSLFTLALDSDGNMWQENVIGNPGVLSLTLSGIVPGSFANGATIDNSEFVMFSDLSIGTDRPRQLDADGNWYPVTQQGPGAPPSFQASTGSVGGVLTLTSFTYTAVGETATLTFSPDALSAPPVGSLYVLNVPGSFLNSQVLEVTASTTNTITGPVTGGGKVDIGSTPITGTATPTFSYGIASITQPPVYTHFPAGMGFFLGPSAGQVGTGSNVTAYYAVTGYAADPALVAAWANSSSVAVYVYITGAQSGSYNFNGIWQVTGIGAGHYPGTSETVNYFTFTYTQSGVFGNAITGSRYALTAATLTLNAPGAVLPAGTPITITGATPEGWNNTWTISSAVNDGQYTVTSTTYDYSTGTATFGYQFASLTNSQIPIANHLITVIGATNNEIFNGTFVITAVGSNTFSAIIPNAPTGIVFNIETAAQAVMFGTVFTFDPGETYVNTNTDVIFGTDTGTGQIVVIGSSGAGSVIPIGAGTRQAVVFFITESGNWTPVSDPITFTIASDANVLNVSKIPIGPPNVIARGIAITEAGANGVPGANFYVITEPVTNTVGTITTVYTSTIINDNVSTTATFSFTDAVLLDSTEIDIPGKDLFNTIELGSPAWCVPYASRMFYGMMLNKVDNFIPGTMSFDGGYLVATNPQPLGWGLYPTFSEVQLLSSPVTGDALYISNTTGAIQPVMGTIAQSAYQDAYNVAIIKPNTLYSVRVTCDCPSGIRIGTLVIDLVSLSNSNFGTVYGSFSVPFQSMGSTMTTFSGTLLTTPFTTLVPHTLSLRVRETNMGIGADIMIDRIEVFPTMFPYLKTEVYGSYVNQPEEVDTSGDGGVIDTSTENAQTCFGGFTMREQLYLLKTSSMYSTRDNPNSEPGGWGLTEVSNRVGAIGINAFDVGEEWAATACRNGIYGFSGTAPQLLNLETLPIWNCINFNAGNTICLRNDTQNRRILCAVPLPTGTSPTGVPTATTAWLPFAPYNPTPTTPNVMLVLNYQALGSFDELMSAIGTHATMFGSLANPDMRRKWTIWQIPTPYMGMVTRANLLDTPLYIGNGIETSKIYSLDPNQRSDDGVAVYGSYCTYGFVNSVKAATLPIFGMHVKRYTLLQLNAEGSGSMNTILWPNTLNARYPYSVPLGIKLTSPAQDDYFRSINCKGQRMFIEVSTNAVGSWFELDKVLLSGMQDAHSSLNPTGGGNAGIF